MEINLDAHRAANDRSGRPDKLIVDGRTYQLTGRLPMRVQLLIAEADAARAGGDYQTIIHATTKAVRILLANPDEADDLLDAVEMDELGEVIRGFYPEPPGASSAPSPGNGTSAKVTSPGSTASTSPPPATAMSQST